MPKGPDPSARDKQLITKPENVSWGRDRVFEAIVCLSSSQRETRAELIAYIRAHYTTLAQLLCAEERDWTSLPRHVAALPVLCRILRECAHRYYRDLLPEGDLLAQPDILRDYLTARMAREKIEQFRLLFLDKNHHLILDELQARGTVNHAPVYPREVAKRCLELKARFLIMVHNHPGGQMMPSKADVVMTQRVKAALHLIGVEIIDHFIIARGTQTSFRQLGLLGEE